MGNYNIFLVPSFFPPFFLTLRLGLQIGQLHYQSTGPQIFKTNWIAHPIPITITAGTITKLAIQHNNWKCGLPGPAGLPGGPADLWRHVKPANSTANYWCTAEWSCLSPKYHFQFPARSTGPCWDRQKQQRSEHKSVVMLPFSSCCCLVLLLFICLCVWVSLCFLMMNIGVLIKSNSGEGSVLLAVLCLPTYCMAFLFGIVYCRCSYCLLEA